MGLRRSMMMSLIAASAMALAAPAYEEGDATPNFPKPIEVAKPKTKKQPRTETKPAGAVAILLRLVGRKSGASLDKLVSETGLQRHSIRGRISTLNSSGTKIESFLDEKRGRCYRSA